MKLCLVAVCVVISSLALADEWPQWRGPSRDGVWRETGLVEKFTGPEIKARWRVPVANGYSGPTVADGRVYVTDRVVEPKEQERVHCFDWQTGKTVWTFAYDCVYKGIGYPDGPRAAVTVQDGRAYSLGAMGNFHCFEAATGKLLWQHDCNTEYGIRMPIWGISVAPLIEGDLVIVNVCGAEACLVAFDRKTGKEAWRALTDRGNYSPPIIVRQAGQRVLVLWTGDRVVGLNPQTGTAHWSVAFPSLRMPLGIANPVVSGDLLYLSGFYDGSLMLRLRPDRLVVDEVWRRRGQSEQNTDALHTIIATPIMQGDYIYGVDSYGELRCLEAKTGDRLWENLTAVPRDRWATIHFVQNGDRTWMFNERGELIIARLSPKGFEELSRAALIKPTLGQLPQRKGVCWSHPAYAYKHVFARNDEELVCASLEAPR